jgi:dihydrodipicolinate synthase/N-acetylneuraminate lyase
MSLKNLNGIVPALNSIFDNRGQIDFEGMKSQVDFALENRVDGLAVNIHAGEFYKLADSERKALSETVIDTTNGKVPVLVGISHTGTEPSLMLGKHAKDAGADGIVVMAPYYYKLESIPYLMEHYERIASSVDLPLMVQDAEDITGVPMEPSLFAALAARNPNIFMIKVEGAKAIQKISETRTLAGKKLVIFGGMAGKSILEELDAGAQGNIPDACFLDLLVPLYRAYAQGQLDDARRILRKYKPWVDFLSEHAVSETSIEKETLRLRGIIKSSYVRGPRLELTKEENSRLVSILRRMKAVDARDPGKGA